MISIIGTGRIGSAIAFLLASTDVDSIRLVNRTAEKAKGHVLDLSSAFPNESKNVVTSTEDFSEISDSEIIIITASVGTYQKDRMEQVELQVEMMKSIASKIKKYASNSKVLIISNPVDVLTYIFLKETEFDRQKVIGVGSGLDSNRLQQILSEKIDCKANEIVNSTVLGEHGDSMVPIYSKIRFKQKKISDLITESELLDSTKKLRSYWKEIRKNKGPSVYGVSKKTYDIVNAIVNNVRLDTSASILLDGEYEIDDICIGMPVSISKEGAKFREIFLDENERGDLQISAITVKKYIKRVYFQLRWMIVF